MVRPFRDHSLRYECFAMPGKNAGLPGICRAPFHRAQRGPICSRKGLESAVAPLRESRAPTFPITASRIGFHDSLVIRTVRTALVPLPVSINLEPIAAIRVDPA